MGGSEEPGELIEVDGKAVYFCGDQTYLESGFSCNERVQFVRDRYLVSSRDAKIGLLKDELCICSGGSAATTLQPPVETESLSTAAIMNQDQEAAEKQHVMGGFGVVSLSLCIVLAIAVHFISRRRSVRGLQPCRGIGRFLLFCAFCAIFLLNYMHQGALLNSVMAQLSYHPNVTNSVANEPAPTKLADGCYHVFLDVGSNIGMHVRFLYEPQLYPKARIARRFFMESFGAESNRDNRDVCVFSFEPNPNHISRHVQLQKAYASLGWSYYPIHAGVGHQAGNITFYRKYFCLLRIISTGIV